MSFLPKDYQAPKTNNHYLKLQEGENRIRIMSAPIFGWEDWLDNKPVRFRMDKKPAKSNDPKKPVRHFWAFIVFNYQEEQIQIMQVTQATIRKSLEALCRDNDWGSPHAFDIKIMKTGEGVDTEYTVNPVPHKAIDAYLVKSFEDKKCNLEALFDNADPFSLEWENYTQRLTSEDDKPLKPNEQKIVSLDVKKAVTNEAAEELVHLLQQCPKEYVESVHSFMKKQKIGSYAALPLESFEKIKEKALIEINNKNTAA